MKVIVKYYLYLFFAVEGFVSDQELPVCDIAGGYTYEAEIIFDRLSKNHCMSSSLQTARAKLADKKFAKWDYEKKSAGILINLFTNSDEICDGPDTTFYRSLNKDLRTGHPEELWKKCKDSLNAALHIIGFQSFEYLYRGERDRCFADTVPVEGAVYHVPRFWSTTLDPLETQYFGGTDCVIYIIKGAAGVNIADISIIEQEREVLIACPSEYIVERKCTNPSDIIQELEKIRRRHPGLNVSEFKPKSLIILTQKYIN